MTSNVVVDSIVMENILDMKMDQVGSNKRHYEDIVMEAMSKPEGQANLLNKLFKETEKLESVDFDKIPDTRGDITKYPYYGQLNDCIEIINNVVADNPTENIKTMNKLHQILLDARPDFVFGFKSDNYIIINLYKCMALDLFAIENICIVDLTDHIRTKLSIELNKKTASQVRAVTKNAKQFIKMYENGQWSTIMKAFRRGKALEFASEYSHEMEPATEEIADLASAVKTRPIFDVNIKASAGNLKDAVKDLKSDTVATITNSPASNILSKVWGVMKWPTIIIGGIILLLLIIRGATYLFINGAAKIKNIFKNNAEILRANIANNDDGSNDGIEKQKKMLDKLENLSDVIEYNTLKAEQAAAIDMSKSNRENFSADEFKAASLRRTSFTGADFEF